MKKFLALLAFVLFAAGLVLWAHCTTMEVITPNGIETYYFFFK